MSARLRILRKVGIGLAVLVVASVIAAILIVRTDWFRQFVRQKVIDAVEEGTGGRAEIGSFSFDWTRLRAGFTDFVIHGSEPASAAPYLKARRIEIGLRFFTNLKLLGVADLEVDRPEANILVAADGSTNVPQPRHPSSSNTTPLETVVDLAVRHFDLANGSVSFNSHKQDFDLHGDNLHVQLWYDSLKQGYHGDISLAPMYAVAGRNRPVNLKISLPVALERDRIEFRNGQIVSNASRLVIDGSVENLRNPRTTAHIQGRVALADLKNVANLPIAPNARGAPSAVDLDVNATVADNIVDVAGSRIVLGQSFIQASGRLRDPAGHGRLQFRSRLAIGELGRLAQVAVRPEGTAQINGTATLDSNGNYDVEAGAEASRVSFQQGARRIANVSLTSPVHLTPRWLDLTGFRLVALGAEVGGHATLEDFARYTIEANLSRLDLSTLAREVGGKNAGYDGTVSGLLEAAGDVKAPDANGVTAHVRLSIAPGLQGVPVSGRLNVDYLGGGDNLTITASYLALPHSRLTLNGSLDKQLNVALDTRDLRDFSPLTGTPPPVVLSGRPATFAGTVTGGLRSPQIAGHLSLSRFAVEGRQFDALEADLAASSSRAAVSAARLERGAIEARFNGTVGLRNWDAAPDQPLSAQASIHNADLADLLALAGVAPKGYSGALNADASVAGTIANPRGSANLTVANGTIRGEPFDSLQAQASLSDRLVTVSGAHMTAGQSRIDLTAEFRHPRDGFDTGQLHAHVRTTPVDLARLQTVQTWRPHTTGLFQLDADVTGELRSPAPGAPPEFVPARVTADASGRGLRVQQQSYGDFTATARTSGQTVNYTASSNFAGSEIRVRGATELAPGYHTNADASISSLPIERAVSLLQPDLPAKGTLSATAHFTGTVDHPEGSLDVTVDHGIFYDEPIDHASARVNYLAGAVEVPQVEIRSGPSAIELDARYDHPAGVLQSGNLQFRVRNGHVDLSRIHNVQKLRPGLAGTLELTGSGAATVRQAEPRVLARDVNLNIAAKGIAAQGKNLGDLTLTANSSGGSVQFALNSNLTGASLSGQGSAQLSGDYPIQAQMTFQNIAWKRLQPLLGAGDSPSPDFDASIDGQVAVNGPALRTSDLSGRLQLSRVQLRAAPPARSGGQPIDIESQGPVALSLDHGMVRIESLHLAGSQTDLKASGSMSLKARTMEATVSAHTNLALLQQLQRDVVSSGEIVADATVRGTFDKPLINGKVELHKASVNDTHFPTGISNASGAIQFNGNSASVENVTAEVGGGKLTLGGLLTYSGQMRFAAHATAKNVRLFLQPGVSTVADADLRLNGRPAASVLSGTVTIDQITYAPESDFASILSRAEPSVESQTPSQLLDGMKLDVTLRTSSATAVQASLAENLQTDANLHIQGTASQPSVLGRINVTQGKLLFFSTSYTVNSGSISFYSPVRIDPILDLSMETQTKGVSVVLHVTGPVDNMKLSYTSDPPLQFQEILGLLAAGQVPTSDPTLLANQPVQPAQSFQQMGESAVLSKALADPVANRLQRVFGVTQLKINPSFNSGSNLPQVQVALQQKITNQLTLTYMTAVDNPGTQVVSGEWALNRQWSASATRDENGLFSIELLYKRHLR